MTPTYERVRQLFDYDPETGVVIRICDVHSGKNKVQCKAGTVVNHINKSTGYMEVRVNGVIQKLHRVIWLWMEGYWPETDIDHINQIKSDNRWGNLRVVSRSCNRKNISNTKNNTSGVKGVGFYKKLNQWSATITNSKKRYNLGYYQDYLDAVAARLAAEQCLKWEGCESSSPAFKKIQEYLTETS